MREPEVLKSLPLLERPSRYTQDAWSQPEESENTPEIFGRNQMESPQEEYHGSPISYRQPPSAPIIIMMILPPPQPYYGHAYGSSYSAFPYGPQIPAYAVPPTYDEAGQGAYSVVGVSTKIAPLLPIWAPFFEFPLYFVFFVVLQRSFGAAEEEQGAAPAPVGRAIPGLPVVGPLALPLRIGNSPLLADTAGLIS